MYEKLGAAAQYVKDQTEINPKVGIVLGSGLGSFVEKIEDQVIISYNDIPHFYQTTVEGHEGRLIIGRVKGVEVAVLQGRVHAYEGLPMEEIVFHVRTLCVMGIESLLLTNAAGAVNEEFEPGDLVIIKDHINMMGQNPLIGKNINELGPRFPDMTKAYCTELRKKLIDTVYDLDITHKEGVYAGLLGPTYETPSEVKMLRILGADMVGMSTVPESIAANHMGVKVAGVSCISNMAAGILDQPLSHDEVKETAAKVMDSFSKILVTFISKLK